MRRSSPMDGVLEARWARGRETRVEDPAEVGVPREGDRLQHAVDALRAELLGAVDLSEQEMQSPFHAISEGLYLSSMVVAVELRRVGSGRRLLEAAEEGASVRGAECLWLFVERDNEAAISLYTSSGYAKQAWTPRHAAFASALEVAQKEPLLLRKSMDNVQRLKPEYTPGDLGFDPLGLKPTDPAELRIMQEKELSHGRLGMLAAAGFLAQEAVTDKTWAFTDGAEEQLILGGWFAAKAADGF